MATTLRWTNLTELTYRLGTAYSDTPATNAIALQGILAGVERTIQNAVRSPVKLTLIAAEWPAPVCDPRLILRWRPVNVLDADAGTANPILLSCTTPYDATTGTALTYGTDYRVYGLGNEDTRYGVSGMLEAVGNGWVGWGWGGGSGWSGSWVRPPTRLSGTLTADRGRIQATYWAGWPDDAIPASIKDAAYLEAATLWSIRTNGRLLSSESLNGYSYQTAPFAPPRPGQTTSFVNTAAAALLEQYIVPAIAGVSPW